MKQNSLLAFILSKGNLSETLAAAISFALLTPNTARAQTYVWADNAQGQVYEFCANCGFSDCNNYWPSNAFWTQSLETNSGCNRQGVVVSQPSNWNPYTTNDSALGVGLYPGGPGATGASVVLGAPSNTYLNEDALINQLTILSNGQLTLGGGTLTVLNAGIEGDGTLVQAGNDLISVPQNGIFAKVAGTNTYTVQPPVLFNNSTAASYSGTLVLGAQNNTASVNGSFETWPGGVIDLTGGNSSLWSGTLTGLNAFGVVSGVNCGQVQINGGYLGSAGGATTNPVILNFPTNHFSWNGGGLSGTIYNIGGIVVDSAGGPTLSGTLYNEGAIYETNAGELNGGLFFNDTNGLFVFLGDGATGAGMTFVNSGILRKDAGTGNSIIYNAVGQGGVFEVSSGMLTLAGDGDNSNGVFEVAANTALDLTGGSRPTWSGTISGSGNGTVLLADGRLYSGDSGLTLAFASNTFWWGGGEIWSGGPMTNSMWMQIAATNAPSIAFCEFYNGGVIMQTNAGGFGVGQYGFANQTQGRYLLSGDGGSITGGYLYNYGIIAKNSGSGVSTINCELANMGGTIEADFGTLVLANDALGSNATFVAAAGATIDLTGGNNQAEWTGTLTGSGQGKVTLASGDFGFPSSGLTLNFPPGLFWWTGGAIYASQTGGGYTNLGSITISPGNGPMNSYGTMYNAGIIRETNLGNFSVGAIAFVNQAGALYEFDGEGGVTGNQFYNYGLIKKRLGNGTSAFNTSLLANYGGIEIDSGAISVPGGFALGGGTLTVALGGDGAGQVGLLAVQGSANISGGLNVVLTNGFAPALSNQYQIVSCSGLTGTFTNFNLPKGLSLTYSNNGVYVTIGTLPVTIQPPVLAGGAFSFGFQTQSNQSYRVDQTTNLAQSFWTTYSNFNGSGAFMQFTVPATNLVQQYFRVSEPGSTN